MDFVWAAHSSARLSLTFFFLRLSTNFRNDSKKNTEFAYIIWKKLDLKRWKTVAFSFCACDIHLLMLRQQFRTHAYLVFVYVYRIYRRDIFGENPNDEVDDRPEGSTIPSTGVYEI